jgi:hypothetical protein
MTFSPPAIWAERWVTAMRPICNDHWRRAFEADEAIPRGIHMVIYHESRWQVRLGKAVWRFWDALLGRERYRRATDPLWRPFPWQRRSHLI